MKNRAKCKLCNSIIESFFLEDFVSCKCGEIGIEGGDQKFKAFAKSFDNFLRVDDEGNEILVKVVETQEQIAKQPKQLPKPTRKEQIDMLESMLKSIESLPPNAMTLPINHYDFYSFMLLVLSILKEEA